MFFFAFFCHETIQLKEKIPIFATLLKGKMPEWSIGPHSKCGVRATVPGVRIPLFPQNERSKEMLKKFDISFFISNAHKLV